MNDKPVPSSRRALLEIEAAVEEVRAIRRRLWEAADCDARRFIERSRERAKHRARELGDTDKTDQ